MSGKTFLVEIGTEELPSKSLRNLAESFSANFTENIKKVGLSYKDVKWFGTPRRLAIQVLNLSDSQPDFKIEKRGPSIAHAFDAFGKPNKAAKSWAYSCGINLDQAERLITDKGEWLLYRDWIKGKQAKTLLPDLVYDSLIKLPIEKLMRWGTKNIKFVRPVHTVTLLLGDQIIPAKILGIECDRIIFGHRFMGESKISISNADQYPKILLDRGKVFADYEQRKSKIKAGLEKAGRKINGKIDLNEKLLEEIVSLVEWPVILTAKFEDKFLNIPSEALVVTMINDQKCFPVYTTDGKLMSNFIFVSNIESKDPKQIIYGNEKVVRTRFADAEFFFYLDRKKRLEDYLPLLKGVVFQTKLGTLYDKTNRIQELSGWIAKQIGANVSHATRAGLLSKCDLMTNMVIEFTEIQGIIGMYYARYDGEEEEVAISLKEHYQPRFSGDAIPSSLVACALSIADKVDTIVGILGILKHPKTSKDPFALRRYAIGLLRIIVEKKLDLDLKILVEKSVHLYNNRLTNSNVVIEVTQFILGRFQSLYQEEGYSVDVIQSVLALKLTRPVDFDTRVKALSHFRNTELLSSLLLMNKRISNILAKSIKTFKLSVNNSMLMEPAEVKLSENLEILSNKLESCSTEQSYQEILVEVTSLKILIDEFFKTVMVNTDNKKLRNNRLALIAKLRSFLLRIADISILR